MAAGDHSDARVGWGLVDDLPQDSSDLVEAGRRRKQPIPGLDLAGRVVTVGSDVTRFRPGDRVFGIGNGAYAEYAQAEQGKLSHTPDSITDEQAAVAAISGGTALQAVTDVGRVQPEQRVLVIGASGGVGSYAVQLAVAHGATVTGVSSVAKADLVRQLGAEHVDPRQGGRAHRGSRLTTITAGSMSPVDERLLNAGADRAKGSNQKRMSEVTGYGPNAR